jgi:superoxide reductase
MNRRDFMVVGLWSGLALTLAENRAWAKEYYPTQVDESLWQGVNRVQNPSQETGLEKLHSPVITAPGKVNAGDVFPVEVAIGRTPHPMGPTHWIEHLQLNIGNQPAGNVIFRSHGYVKAATKFEALLGDELKGRTVSLIVQIKCNLHGIWQNHFNVSVV